MDARINNTEIITLGSYLQNQRKEKEPIQWIVLSQDCSEALLLSLRVLDVVNYHGQNIEITWENSDIRRWCNTTFYNSAFSEVEKKAILLSHNDNKDPYEVTVPGKEYHPFPGCTTHEIVSSSVVSHDTIDHVFFLSVQECMQYYDLLNQSRYCPEVTEYAKGKDALTTRLSFLTANNTYRESKEEYCSFWWLRSRAIFGSHAAICDLTGKVWDTGSAVFLDEYCNIGVRPAIRIDLKTYDSLLK